MMKISSLEQEALSRFAHQARQSLGSQVGRIILFGSRARGEADEYSDLDIAVVFREGVHSEIGRVRDLLIDLAWKISFETGLDLSPHALTARDAEDGLGLGRALRSEGIEL